MKAKVYNVPEKTQDVSWSYMVTMQSLTEKYFSYFSTKIVGTQKNCLNRRSFWVPKTYANKYG